MASSGAQYSDSGKLVSSPQPEITRPAVRGSSRSVNYFPADVSLRVLLFAASLVAVVVMVTSKQTEMIPVPGLPFIAPVPAKFSYSPALKFFVGALSIACLYSIITTFLSLSAISKASSSKKLILFLAISDVVMLGLVASATGTAGGVAYIGLKGNSHSGWRKICNVYDKFCRHQGSSIGVSFVAAMVLLLLSMLSTVSLYKRIP